MKARSLFVSAMLVAACSAVPATSAAAGVADRFDAVVAQLGGVGSNAMFAQIVAPKVKGYRWNTIAYKPSPSSGTTLSIQFSRSGARGTQRQSSSFTWSLSRSALQMDADLKPALLRTGDGMGTNGSISMKLTDTERYARVPAGEGCTGSISFRIGRFGGKFRFDARDQYFKRISMQGAQVFLFRAHDYRCAEESDRPPPCPEGMSLNAIDLEAGVAVGAFKTIQGKVTQTVFVARKSGTADSTHSISATVAVPESFEASDDLSRASVDGDAAGPWLSGDLDYIAPPSSEGADEDCGAYRSSNGLATGDYTAHFDSLGPVTPASTGMAASIRREI